MAVLTLGNTAANDWFGVEFVGWGSLYDSEDNSFGSGLPAEIGGHTVTFVGSDETNKGLHFMLLGDYTSDGWPESLVWSDTKFGEWDRDRLSGVTPLTGAFGPGGATVTYWSEYLVGDPPPAMYADATNYSAQLSYITGGAFFDTSAAVNKRRRKLREDSELMILIESMAVICDNRQ